MRDAIARHSGVRQVLAEALRLQAAANGAASRNAATANAGGDTTETLAELRASIEALLAMQDGLWAVIFFHLTNGPIEELLHDQSYVHH